ncbi:putative tetratricopeptide-like helical domain superfamily [Dioscorea sansibarensis]
MLLLKRPTRAPLCGAGDGADHLFKLITGHPSPSHLYPHLPLNPSLVSDLLSRLLLSHSPSSTALSLFLHSLPHSSPSSLHTLLQILSRARHFSLSSNLIQSLLLSRPSILSPYSLSILLSSHAKFQPFNSTLHLFDELHHSYNRAGLPFGVDEFNVLLRAFCVQRRMGDARRIFNRYHASFAPNSSTLNTLLLGFKEVGDVTALNLFYNEMIVRGFEPDVVSFNIRIDAYCKKGRFFDALKVFDEMAKRDLSPTLQTLTTLVYGSGIAGDLSKARELFDEMFERGLDVDRGAYNALISCHMRVGNLKGGMAVMDEMVEKGIELDDVSYYTVLSGLKKFEDVCEVYGRMIRNGFVPRMRTVMLLMKVFRNNKRAGV